MQSLHPLHRDSEAADTVDKSSEALRFFGTETRKGWRRIFRFYRFWKKEDKLIAKGLY